MKVFIGYRRSDTGDDARTIYSHLSARHGPELVFMDVEGIGAGDHWLQVIRSQLVSCDVFLALIGPGWLTAVDERGRPRLHAEADITRLEIRTALTSSHVTVIPVLLRGAETPSRADLPDDISSLAYQQAVRITLDGEEGLQTLDDAVARAPTRRVDWVGGFFHVESRLSCTRNVDKVVVTSRAAVEESDPHAMFLLRTAHKDDTDIRGRFVKRFECWGRTEASSVVPLHERSDLNSDDPAPFAVLDALTEGATLEASVRETGPPPTERVDELVRVAAELLRAAHASGVFLLTLPLREFLLAEDGVAHFHGFETAVDAASAVGCGEVYWKRTAEDWQDLPPEATRVGKRLGPAADVFAIGRFLQRLLCLPATSTDHLNDPERSSRLQCIVFHATATDAGLRFRSVDHFLRFFDEWRSIGSSVEPLTVRPDQSSSRDEGASARVAFGKYPVSNFEYEMFCRATGHAVAPIDPNDQPALARIRGPLCPVVNASLADARRYCDWLSSETDSRWRLPTERERRLDRVTASEELESTVMAGHLGDVLRGTTVVGGLENGSVDHGCYDLKGHVWEWCDSYFGRDPRFVLMGGSFRSRPPSLAHDVKKAVVRTYRAADVGFRVVKELR